ncbi:MAG: septum site-determining protein MinC [Moraxella sp.]|nr:septum site-determining protein MinC [Moraxella sp.]
MSEMIASLYGKMLVFSRLQLTSVSLKEVEAAMKQLHQGERTVPVVLDVAIDTLPKDFELSALIDTLWSCGIGVLGVVDGVLNEQADALKLVRFPADGNRIERLQPKAIKEVAPIAAEEHSVTVAAEHSEQVAQMPPEHKEQGSLVHEQMLRSGQTVHYLGGDLILTSHVNRGAEAVTDGNLHVYGKGEGRLVAGATGDASARIFCQNFDPTLVSVAGMYCLRDDIPDEMIGQAVQISCSSDKKLIFTLMKQ